METESQLEKFSRIFLKKFSNWLYCIESFALSKLNWKHQKSIENIKSQLQTSKVNGKLQILNTILRTFLLFLFVSVVDQQEKEEKSKLWICGVRQPLDIKHFHLRAMLMKVHLDFVQGLQVKLKGLVSKNKGHKSF